MTDLSPNRLASKSIFLALTLLCSPILAAEFPLHGIETPDPQYEIRVEKNIMVPARDGVKLATDVWFPVGAEGKLPAILARTPYSKGGHAAVRFAFYGYVVVVQDVRGKYDSEGIFTIMAHDAEDGYDALTWIAQQEWSNGKIATYGCSYSGENQILLAKLKHPNHTTMIAEAAGGAIGTASDSYAYMGVFEGGAALLDEAVEWFMEKGGAKYKKEHGIGRPASDEDLKTLPVIGMIDRCGGPRTDWDEMLAHTISDPWWNKFDGVSNNDSIHIPALHVNSWFDYGVAETLCMFNLFQRNATNQTARENQYCIIYPTKHCCFGDATDSTKVSDLFLGDSRMDNFAIYLKWCDYWLKGEGSYVLDMPRVQYFVMGENRWRQNDQWPPDEVEYTKFYLTPGDVSINDGRSGLLSLKPPARSSESQIVYDPSNPAPSYQWPGPIDTETIDARNDILTYQTVDLGESVEVTGPIEATLFVSSCAKDSDFIVKLLDVTPDKGIFLITQGTLRARFREGFNRQILMQDGPVYAMNVKMETTSYVFGKGHRIRIDISSSDFPRLTRNLNTGRDNYSDTTWVTAVNEIHHSIDTPSHVLLPIIPKGL